MTSNPALDASRMSRLPNAHIAWASTVMETMSANARIASASAAIVWSRAARRSSGLRPRKKSPIWRLTSVRGLMGASICATEATTKPSMSSGEGS